MKYLVLVSHGGLAEGIQSSLAMFAGDKIDQVLATGLQNGKSVDDFAEEFREVIAPLKAEDSVLVMADIVGGSPLTTALNVLAKKDLLETATVLGGMNLTMALTGLVMKDLLEGKDLVDNILSEATSALQEFTVVANDDKDDV